MANAVFCGLTLVDRSHGCMLGQNINFDFSEGSFGFAFKKMQMLTEVLAVFYQVFNQPVRGFIESPVEVNKIKMTF